MPTPTSRALLTHTGGNIIQRARVLLDQKRRDTDLSGLRAGTAGSGSAVQAQYEALKSGRQGKGLGFAEWKEMMGGKERFGTGIFGFIRARAQYKQYRIASGDPIPEKGTDALTPEPEAAGEFEAPDVESGLGVSDLTFGD